jgi:hypothetical protein
VKFTKNFKFLNNEFRIDFLHTSISYNYAYQDFCHECFKTSKYHFRFFFLKGDMELLLHLRFPPESVVVINVQGTRCFKK